MRRLFEVSRYAVIIPSAASIIGAIVLMILGSIEIVRSALDVVLKQVPLKETVVAILTSVDAILLGTVLLVIGYGLYELFIDTNSGKDQLFIGQSFSDKILSQVVLISFQLRIRGTQIEIFTGIVATPYDKVAREILGGKSGYRNSLLCFESVIPGIT